MPIKIIKRIVDIITVCAIVYVLYLGYFIFFDKPTTSYEITSLYVKTGYAYLTLFIILIIRTLVNKKRAA
ncbi:hypothetical protein BVG16_15450 [Paenibacillus selenitireducens]|uniref:Uncharacterized protein n=1 Tax=Paenibacillus selenitireducens TaxID=1324314 RepID=A0A1T2XDB4_9BACL|nr:hypothetical protein BVG16_15450 [Paenibacillus selenitireducens]